MKKEAFFAIFIGIVVGLGITFGIYKIKKSKTTPIDQQMKDLGQKPTPTPPTDSQQKLLITSPQDETVLSDTTLRVSGKAEANEMIVISVNDTDYITQADSIGAFAKDVELSVGGNIIEVTAISIDGKQTKVTQNVTVSTESLDAKVESAASDEATPSAQASSSAKPTKKPTATPTTKPKVTPKETP